MKKNGMRKFLALALCLAMAVSMAAIPALAAPGDDAAPAPEAPAAEAPAPVEAPAAEAPAGDVVDAPAGDVADAPAGDVADAPAGDVADTPAGDDVADAPAGDDVADAPAGDDAADAPDTDVADAPADEDVDVGGETPTEPVEDDGAEAPEAEPVSRPAGGGVAPIGTFSLLDVGGFTYDWTNEDLQEAWGSKFGAIQTEDGCYIYLECGRWNDATLCVITDPGTPWYDAAVDITTKAAAPLELVNTKDGNASWNDLGAQVVTYVGGDTRYVEGFFPNEILPQETFTLTIGDVANITLTPGEASDAETPEESELPEEDELPEEPVNQIQDVGAAYNGIVIDGDFSDWDAVPRYDIHDITIDGQPKTWDTVDHFSIVWDGDWIYILLVADGDRDWQGNLIGAGNWNSVTGAGPNGNGQFGITTDLGRTLMVQPFDRNGEIGVDGVDGASAAVNNKEWFGAPHMWELAVPASALPEYSESINFGLYLVEPTLTGITDLQGDEGVKFGGQIVVDGMYDDWTGYPHTEIQYDRAGIQHHDVDGEAALWSDGGILYGHVVTEHPDHVLEMGGEFMAAVTIAFNGDRDYKEYPHDGNFYPRILALGADGSITTLNEGTVLPEGTYTFYIFDTRTDPEYQFGHEDENGTWHSATAAELKENAFGTMKVTVSADKNEMEYDLDLRKVADYIGQDADDFKLIEAQYGRIGQQWVQTAGTPTGAALGVALAVGAVGVPACAAELRNRRAKRKEEESGEEK